MLERVCNISLQAVLDCSEDLAIDLKRKSFPICLKARDVGVLIKYFLCQWS